MLAGGWNEMRFDMQIIIVRNVFFSLRIYEASKLTHTHTWHDDYYCRAENWGGWFHIRRNAISSGSSLRIIHNEKNTRANIIDITKHHGTSTGAQWKKAAGEIRLFRWVLYANKPHRISAIGSNNIQMLYGIW